MAQYGGTSYMSPDFALLLSGTGISLLQRQEGGWAVRDTTPVDGNDLHTGMRRMQKIAAENDLARPKVKLIIPNEQIKYLSLPAPENAKPMDVEKGVVDALDGATPYQIEELKFDWVAVGPTVQVAAVALETLEEAETFVRDFGFDPIGNVANAPFDKFDGEVFFGLAHGKSELARETETFVIVPLPDTARNAPPMAFSTSRDKATPPKAIPQPEPEQDTLIAQGNEAAVNLGASLAAKPQRSGFYTMFKSRRAATRTTAAYISSIVPAAKAIAPSVDLKDEAQKFTLFGARSIETIRKRPIALGGLAGLAALIVAGVGLGAYFSAPNVTTDIPTLSSPQSASLGLPTSMSFEDTPETGLSQALSSPEIAPSAPQVSEPATPSEVDTPVQLAALPQTQQDFATAPTDQLSDPEVSSDIEALLDRGEAGEQAPQIDMSPQDALMHYAVSGVWTLSPTVPDVHADVALGDVYIASIDPVVVPHDAVALPDARIFSSDGRMQTLSAPAPFGTQFSFDTEGRVVPSAEGTLSPEGHLVYAGRPALTPPEMPEALRALGEAAVQEQETASAATSLLTSSGTPLIDLKPRPRPNTDDATADLSPAQLAAATVLSGPRPKARPSDLEIVSLARVEENPEEPIGLSANIASSVVPKLRPANLKTKNVTRTQVAKAAPIIPSKSNVAQRATTRNAIALNQVSVLGIFGKGNSRKALVRLSSGRRQMITVGDRLDGGRVAAIGTSEVRYVKRGKNVVLKMPKG